MEQAISDNIQAFFAMTKIKTPFSDLAGNSYLIGKVYSSAF